jgi:hypothetical protein
VKNKIIKICLFVMFGLLTVTIYLNNNPFSDHKSTNLKKEMPSTIVQNYWTAALSGDASNLDEFIDDTPEIYYRCYYENVKECSEKTKSIDGEVNSSKINVNATVEQKETKEILKTKIPNAIFQKKWQSITVANQWLNSNEARVRVLIKSEEFVLTKDILLYKGSDGWKIFRFVDEGEREAFAPIVGMNQSN